MRWVPFAYEFAFTSAATAACAAFTVVTSSFIRASDRAIPSRSLTVSPASVSLVITAAYRIMGRSLLGWWTRAHPLILMYGHTPAALNWVAYEV